MAINIEANSLLRILILLWQIISRLTRTVYIDLISTVLKSPSSPMAKGAKLKAILQVLIYKALYDKSYLGSKTTMTSGE